MLKKLTVTLLICVLLCLTACSKPPAVPEPEAFDPGEPLTICFDLDNRPDNRHYDFSTGSKYTGAKQRRTAVDQFLQDMKDAGGPENVQVEFIEGFGSDREGQLTHLRAEIMAGKGPDLFVLCQSGDRDLFQFPEKKMEDGLFLPLDRYMETAQFMEPDRMVAPVFDAGMSSGGTRYLLPMTYNICVAAMREKKLEFDPAEPHDLDELLDIDSPIGGVLSLWREYGGFGGNVIAPLLNPVADFKAERLCFTEDELAELFERLRQYETAADSDGFSKPSGVAEAHPIKLDGGVASRSWAAEPVALVPFYDRDGGVTAWVEAYAGVNANAANPAGAFWAADFLLGREYMMTSDLHMYMRCDVLSIYADLGGPDTPLPYNEDIDNGITIGQHWDAFRELTGMITDGAFPTQLDTELTFAYWDYCGADSDSAREKVVSEVYSTMRMMLGES